MNQAPRIALVALMIVGPACASAKIETCFSPDQPCAEKMTEFISSAASSLDIAVYDVNEVEIVHAIAVKSKVEKKAVRVIVDARQAKGRSSKVGLLRKAGVPVRFGAQRGYMHDKFTIVDGARLETGSYNYTRHATEANQENQIYLDDPEVVRAYQARFDAMWAAAKIVALPATVGPAAEESED